LGWTRKKGGGETYLLDEKEKKKKNCRPAKTCTFGQGEGEGSDGSMRRRGKREWKAVSSIGEGKGKRSITDTTEGDSMHKLQLARPRKRGGSDRVVHVRPKKVLEGFLS